jgi:hypothetical protein
MVVFELRVLQIDACLTMTAAAAMHVQQLELRRCPSWP